MKKLAAFVAIALAAVVAADLLFGYIAKSYLVGHRLPGDYEEIDYLIKDLDEEILILGSSVALNGLNPNVIADSLGLSCYDGGANGQVMPFYESMLECAVGHPRRPSVLLLGLTPNELAGTGVGERFNLLLPYYHTGYPAIDRRLDSKSAAEPYLLRSSLYRYNTIWWRILLYHFITPGVKGEHGFTGKPVPVALPTLLPDTSATVTAERRQSFAHIADLCRQSGIHLVVFFPPIYQDYSGPTATIDYVARYCAAAGIACFDDSRDPYFLSRPDLFYDNIHLNIVGCQTYTSRFAHRLKPLLLHNPSGSTDPAPLP